MNKTQASEAILGQLLNLSTNTVDNQMLKIILLKRITISILSSLLYNTSGMKGMTETIGPNMMNLPKASEAQAAEITGVSNQQPLNGTSS